MKVALVAFVVALAVASSSVEACKMTHSSAYSKLQQNGITVSSSGNCSDRNNPTCTSLEQINCATIDGIIRFKTQSGCPTNVTGGTETGHSGGTYSHWNGYKIDISLSSCNQNYIPANYKFIGYRGDGAAQYQSSNGNIYAKEGNHWDITYYN
eukprot:TRINITY_DN2026_c0_g1_i1.p2 TRINITY_DN2026_c0_g1~~TRINITY_DN2026_c0_g1_i1.p2  ORF type:complete len:153 (+),score=24.20 TRINITY_DN2026_c0_g1_i1:55-513(+)